MALAFERARSSLPVTKKTQDDAREIKTVKQTINLLENQLNKFSRPPIGTSLSVGPLIN